MQSSSSAFDNSADDGLDLLRSMIAEEHVDVDNEQAQPQMPAHHQHASTITIGNMSELLRGSSRRRRSSTQDDDDDDDDDDDVDMLKGIADADDGGSLASYNNPDANISTTYAGHKDDDDDDRMASPPSSPDRNNKARRGTSERPTNYDSILMQMQMKYQRGPPMSPMKHSRELSTEDVKYANADGEGDVPSEKRPYLHIDHYHPHLQPPREDITTLQDMLERERSPDDNKKGQSNFMYADTSFMRRTSSIGSNTTSKAGNVTSLFTTNSYITVGDGYMHRDDPLHRSSSSVDVDVDADAEEGDKNKDESSSIFIDNSSTKKKPSSTESSRPRSSASSSSNNNHRSKTYPPSSSPASAPQPQMANPPPPPPQPQPPLAVAGLPPPPPPHLIEQFQTQAKSQAFQMMAVQHLPVHIQAEAAAAAQAAIAIVAARAGVKMPNASMPPPTATGGAQPPQLSPQQLQMLYQQFMQMPPSRALKNDPPSQEGTNIDNAAAGEAVAAAATASKATVRKGRAMSTDLPQVVTTSTSISPLASPTTSDKRIKQNVVPKTAKKNLTEKESSAHGDTVMTPPTMPNTPLTATAALSSSTLDVDVSSAPSHYFSVSDRDDQSVSSAYSASSRGSGTVSCNSNACRGPLRRRVTSASSMSTSSGGKAKNQQPKKTPRQVKKRGGAASPKGIAARSRQSSSSSSYRGGAVRSMQRARSYTAPGNINGSNGFGIQIPPLPTGLLSPLPSPPIGSPLPDVRSMRVTSPPRTSLTPTPTPSSADRPRNRASTAPLVRHHSYPVTSNSKTKSKAPPATPVPPQFFHSAAMTGISPPPVTTAAAASETPASYPSSTAATTPATPANAWLGQPPSSLLPGGRVSPVPFFVPPFPIAGMPMMPAGQQQATIQCWCGGSYPAGNKQAETDHAMTTQHKDWIARSQAQFYKMQNSALR